ncbi:hypothetical protein [Streptomyces olivaceoviridis]
MTRLTFAVPRSNSAPIGAAAIRSTISLASTRSRRTDSVSRSSP